MITDSNHVYLLDGAMGTELLRRGVKLPLPLWSAVANTEAPESVLAIHRDYLAAGANVLTTNTFRTTPRAYYHSGLSLRRAATAAHDSLRQAVELAQKATREQENVLVAGSLTALEDCYQPELCPGRAAALEEYEELVEWMTDAGVDLLLFETMGHLEEIEAALTVSEHIKLPRWLSMILHPEDESKLLSGHDLKSALKTAQKSGVSACLLNCNTVDLTRRGIQYLKENWTQDWGVYPNLGVSQPETDGTIRERVTERQLANEVAFYLEQGVRIVGTCCGSTPENIRLLRNLIDTQNQSK